MLRQHPILVPATLGSPPPLCKWQGAKRLQVTYVDARIGVGRQSIGFEAHVNKGQAIDWLEPHRLTVFDGVDLAKNDLAKCEGFIEPE